MEYELTLCAVGGRPVSSSTGMTIPADADADATGPQLRFDTLLLTGGAVFPAHPVDPELREAVTSVAAQSGRVCSICSLHPRCGRAARRPPRQPRTGVTPGC